MIVLTLALLQAAYSPETEAVMNRSRARAEQRRAERADEAAAAREKAAEDARRPTAPPPEQESLPLPPKVAARLQACLDRAIADPDEGARVARQWTIEDGGFSAQQCLGFALARSEHWMEAADAFDAGALDAQKANRQQDAARLWGQAGNAALASGKPDKARGFFDAALGQGMPDGLAKGEIFLDRARAMVALNDLPAARQSLDFALKNAPADPLAWLLSATLARRQDDLARAKADIAEAQKRAPDDASVALEAGNIAILAGDEPGARAAWQRAFALAPKDSAQAASAQAALAQLAPQTGGAESSVTKSDAPAASGQATAPAAPRKR